ncbi:hypothetical protein LCL95_06755 [Bacillus timonensis]|nr:hypothetical protein [Bacillus timonensis]
MEITISPMIKEKMADFKIGVIHYQDISVGESPQMLKGRLQLFQESLYFDLEEKELTNFKGIKNWRKVFKTIGTDPSRYRPSVESLYRRIKKQSFIGSINSAADLNNFFSLKYEIPIGIYDMNKIEGPVEITVGHSNDEYIGINGRTINMENKLLSSDHLGPFGSPYVDSERTTVTELTKEALHIIYLSPTMTKTESTNLTNSLKEMFLQIHGGVASVDIIE